MSVPNITSILNRDPVELRSLLRRRHHGGVNNIETPSAGYAHSSGAGCAPGRVQGVHKAGMKQAITGAGCAPEMKRTVCRVCTTIYICQVVMNVLIDDLFYLFAVNDT